MRNKNHGTLLHRYISSRASPTASQERQKEGNTVRKTSTQSGFDNGARYSTSNGFDTSSSSSKGPFFSFHMARHQGWRCYRSVGSSSVYADPKFEFNELTLYKMQVHLDLWVVECTLSHGLIKHLFSLREDLPLIALRSDLPTGVSHISIIELFGAQSDLCV